MCLGLAAAFVDAFFDLAFELGFSFSEAGLDVERLRGGFLGGALPFGIVVSFNGTFVTAVRDWKKSLATSDWSSGAARG